MKVLVLGATGMLGHALLRALLARPGLTAVGAVRDERGLQRLPPSLRGAAQIVGDLGEVSALQAALERCAPDAVVNCTSLARPYLQDPARAFALYSVLPQRLAFLCRQRGSRLVQISSDGVYSGARGRYGEQDIPDATDVYGTSKWLGEVGAPGAMTIRTSMLGPELGGGSGLLEWFLAQQGPVRSFNRAIFSGLPTVELSRIIRDIVLPRPDLEGVYHVAAAPISKLALLELVAQAYERKVEFVPDPSVVMDRSLSAERFRAQTGYVPGDWQSLVRAMHADHVASQE